jgi:hypothetical protein
MMHTIKAVALPYFEKFSSLEEILAACSSDDNRIYPLTHCPSNLARAKKAIAAAFLLGKKNGFDDLVDRYLTRETPDPQSLTDFLVLVRGLQQKWAERMAGHVNSSQITSKHLTG